VVTVLYVLALAVRIDFFDFVVDKPTRAKFPMQSEVKDVEKEGDQKNVFSSLQPALKCPPTAISNPGSVCYITSFLQQLFAIDKVKTEFSRLRDTNQQQANLIVSELMKLFDKIHERQQECEESYDPIAFCEAFLQFKHQQDTSSPLKTVDDQGDVATFITDLLTVLEVHSNFDVSLFKGTKSIVVQSLLQTQSQKQTQTSTDQSTLAIETTASIPLLSKHQHESFYYLSLVIKSNRRDSDVQSLESNTLSIRNALRDYFKPVHVDYPWLRDETSGSDKKVTEVLPSVIITRLCISPPHLLIHLQRFRFDLKRRCRIKVGNYCQFPLALDLADYCEPSCQCQYELGGFIVHEGDANDGHYYSFVKQRSSLEWFELDDELSDEFRIEYCDEEAFGDDDDPDSFPSAVILVYDLAMPV